MLGNIPILESNSALSTKIEETHTYDPAIPFLEVCFRENSVYKETYKENICNSRKVETTYLYAEKRVNYGLFIQLIKAIFTY